MFLRRYSSQSPPPKQSGIVVVRPSLGRESANPSDGLLKPSIAETDKD